LVFLVLFSMGMSSDIDKLFVILKEIRDSVNEMDFKIEKSRAEGLINFLENVDLSAGVNESFVESYLLPLEKLRKYPCPLIHDSHVEDFLSNEGICVGAFDGSSHDPGAHFRVSMLLVNVGYWVCDYFSGEIMNGNRAKVFLDVTNYREARLRAKEFEYRVAEDLWDNKCRAKRVLLYDESFNLKYTLSWDIDSRKGMGDLLRKHLDKMISLNVLPVAIFYTRSSDLYRFYEAYQGDKPTIDMSVPDKVIMDIYLDYGERSSIFAVKSSVVNLVNLDLAAFYVKTSGGVMRVEFPSTIRNNIDLIHCTVLAQSILGEGYPLALQRAHEWAVLTYNDRLAIEEEIARLLHLPYPDMLYSGKRASKRWPIA